MHCDGVYGIQYLPLLGSIQIFRSLLAEAAMGLEMVVEELSAHASISENSGIAAAPAVLPAQPPSASPRWRTADFSVLGLWIAVVAFTLAHHEKWADEAQAWLIARDLSLKSIWFHELRYEGSPGLWHTILWVAQRVFRAPYAALGAIGMACATAGVAFVLWRAPFPRPLRYLLVFSYFMLFQYAVVARSYVLFPLFVFWAASAYSDHKRPERITIPLALLALLSLHGALMAGALGLAYLIQAARGPGLLAARRRYILCAATLAAVLLLTFFVVKPTSDVDSFVKPAPSQHIYEPSRPAKLASVLSGALLDFTIPSAIFFLLAAAWCAFRRKLLPFLLPTAALIFLYVFVHGLSHHHGTVFVAVIAGLWIAWPTPEESARASLRERRATWGMTALLTCLLAVNVWDAVVSVRYEYLYPYSGAEDAARYLNSVQADQHPIFGYTYGMPAVQAYFDHNILANMPTTYYHHGSPAFGAFIDLDQLQNARPDFLVFLSGDPTRELATLEPVLDSYGYVRAHFSDGYLFFKRSLMDRQVYVVYRRIR